MHQYVRPLRLRADATSWNPGNIMFRA